MIYILGDLTLLMKHPFNLPINLTQIKRDSNGRCSCSLPYEDYYDHLQEFHVPRKSDSPMKIDA